MLVLRWGDPTAFVKLPWSSLLSPISGGVSERFSLAHATLALIFVQPQLLCRYSLRGELFVFFCLNPEDLLSRRIFILKGHTLWARCVAGVIVLVRMTLNLSPDFG